MGTRGFIGFVVDGVEKLGYTHWGGYNGGVGTAMLRFLWSHDIEQIRGRAKALRVVSDELPPTDKDIEPFQGSYDPHVGGSSERPTWYQLLRHNQDDPYEMLAAGVVEDSAAFALDSLMCEGGVLVDFDADRLEWYDGFQSIPHDRGRFAGRGTPQSAALGNTYYYEVALRASWPLADLPDEAAFIAATSGEGDES